MKAEDKSVNSVEEPIRKSYDNAKKAVKDRLTIAKFACVHGQADSTISEGAKPLMPFLFDELEKIISAVMKRCVKSTVLDAATSTAKLLMVDLKSGDNCVVYSKVRIGFDADSKVTAKLLRLQEKFQIGR